MKKIDELTLENFKFFRGLETLKFNSKNILVYGENGSGKSNLLDFLIKQDEYLGIFIFKSKNKLVIHWYFS